MNYHETLGVAPNATPEEIKAAYKSLAQKYHPDKPDGDTGKFKEIKDAYEELMGVASAKREKTTEEVIETLAYETFAQLTEQVVDLALANDNYVDVVDVKRQQVKDGLDQAREGINELKEKIKLLKKLVKNVVYKTEENEMVEAFNRRIETFHKNIEGGERAIKVGNKVLELLDGYSFKIREETLLRGSTVTLSTGSLWT